MYVHMCYAHVVVSMSFCPGTCLSYFVRMICVFLGVSLNELETGKAARVSACAYSIPYIFSFYCFASFHAQPRPGLHRS